MSKMSYKITRSINSFCNWKYFNIQTSTFRELLVLHLSWQYHIYPLSQYSPRIFVVPLEIRKYLLLLPWSAYIILCLRNSYSMISLFGNRPLTHIKNQYLSYKMKLPRPYQLIHPVPILYLYSKAHICLDN